MYLIHFPTKPRTDKNAKVTHSTRNQTTPDSDERANKTQQQTNGCTAHASELTQATANTLTHGNFHTVSYSQQVWSGPTVRVSIKNKLIQHLCAASGYHRGSATSNQNSNHLWSFTHSQRCHPRVHGDDKQSPSGSENKMEIRTLRKILLNAPVGLRADQQYYSLSNLVSGSEASIADLFQRIFFAQDCSSTLQKGNHGGREISRFLAPKKALPKPRKPGGRNPRNPEGSLRSLENAKIKMMD